MEFLRALWQQVSAVWSRFGRLTKIGISAVATACIAVVIAVAYWAGQTEYSVLFSDLSVDDAANIAAKLDQDQIPYEISEDGSTLRLPANRVPKVRMDLAVEGLPLGPGKGFDLFDGMSLGTTPFVQNVNYLRAIQSELAKTIMQLDPVISARVHIVQPESTPFIREEKPVTASIVVKTKEGVALSSEVTKGIVQLTAGSVQGLSPDNVTVLDSAGHVLSDKVKAPEDGMTTEDQLKHQRNVEAYLATKAQEVLSRLLGPGRTVVRVTADISFVNTETVSDKYDPDQKVLSHELAKSMKSTGSGGPSGVAGAASNLSPVIPTSLSSGGGGIQEEETIESHYEVSKTHLESKDKQAKINRLTVAVMIAPQKPKDKSPGEAGPEIPLPRAEVLVKGEAGLRISLAEAEELVKQAVGFDPGRGDQIQVSLATYPKLKPVKKKSVKTAAKPAPPAGFSTLNVIQMVLVLVMLAVAGIIAWRMMKRRKQKPSLLDSGRFTPEELQILRNIANVLKGWMKVS